MDICKPPTTELQHSPLANKQSISLRDLLISKNQNNLSGFTGVFAITNGGTIQFLLDV